ncbi:MAG: response regulator [Magnetococcales bacterium]|nr:response regulator [Magnetococcales bacterium]
MTKILIVDDDAEFRENLFQALSNLGFSVTESPSGRDALDRTANEFFDIVLIDLMMPNLSGIDTVREMKRRRDRQKVIMITAFSTIQNAVESIKLGVSDYIVKPFKIEDLNAAIHRTLEEARFEDEVRINDLDQTLGSLANSIRQRIIDLLGTKPPMRLMEIRQALYIEDHTKVVFHLKILKESGLVEQHSDRTYTLSAAGVEVLGFLKDLKSRLP